MIQSAERNSRVEVDRMDDTLKIQTLLEQKRKESRDFTAEEMDAMWDRSLQFFEETAKDIAQ